MSDNITITGNIAADPERRITGTGVPITTFRVASSQRRFDRATGQWVETGTNWYQVSAFRSLAMHAFASLHRGERVIVTGRLRLRAWETPTKKGLSVEIDADGIGHDLLWGTTQYSRATRDADSWPAPGAAAPAEADAAGGQQASWPTVTPGQGGTATPDRGGDWGAPAPEADAAAAPSAADDREPVLQDTPF